MPNMRPIKLIERMQAINTNMTGKLNNIEHKTHIHTQKKGGA